MKVYLYRDPSYLFENLPCRSNNAISSHHNSQICFVWKLRTSQNLLSKRHLIKKVLREGKLAWRNPLKSFHTISSAKGAKVALVELTTLLLTSKALHHNKKLITKVSRRRSPQHPSPGPMPWTSSVEKYGTQWRYGTQPKCLLSCAADWIEAEFVVPLLHWRSSPHFFLIDSKEKVSHSYRSKYANGIDPNVFFS